MTILVRGNGRDSQHASAARRVSFTGVMKAKSPFDSRALRRIKTSYAREIAFWRGMFPACWRKRKCYGLLSLFTMNASPVSCIALAMMVFLPAVSVANPSIYGQLLDAPGPGYRQQADQFSPPIAFLPTVVVYIFQPQPFNLRSEWGTYPLPEVGKQIRRTPSFHDLLNNFQLTPSAK